MAGRGENGAGAESEVAGGITGAEVVDKAVGEAATIDISGTVGKGDVAVAKAENAIRGLEAGTGECRTAAYDEVSEFGFLAVGEVDCGPFFSVETLRR